MAIGHDFDGIGFSNRLAGLPMTATPLPADGPELRHLRCFLAVAEAENFTRAAKRLRISQPSMSQAIAQLERALGAALFVRSGRRVQLTEAGGTFRGTAALRLRKVE